MNHYVLVETMCSAERVHHLTVRHLENFRRGQPVLHPRPLSSALQSSFPHEISAAISLPEWQIPAKHSLAILSVAAVLPPLLDLLPFPSPSGSLYHLLLMLNTRYYVGKIEKLLHTHDIACLRAAPAASG